MICTNVLETFVYDRNDEVLLQFLKSCIVVIENIGMKRLIKQTHTIQDLLNGLMLRSGNDCGLDVERFVGR